MTDARVRLLHVRPPTPSGSASASDANEIERLTDGDWNPVVRTAHTAADAVSVLDAADVDCVVCEQQLSAETGVDALAAVRERHPSVPVVFHAAEADGVTAAAATRLDVTEYVPDAALDGETLGDRVRAAVSETETDTDTEANPRSAMPDAETLFDALFDHPASFVGVLDPDGTLRRANDAALSLVEAAPADVCGEPFPETPWWTHSADLQRRLREAIAVAADGEVGELVADHYGPDGERVTVDLAITPVVEGGAVTALVAAGYDVTERENARRRLERTLERIDDAFFALDDDWRFTYVNGRAEQVLDRESDDLLGRNVWTEFPEAVDDRFYEEYHRAMDEQTVVTFEEHFEPLDLWAAVTAYPAEDGLSVYFRDVGDRKRRERVLTELLEANRDLMGAKSKDEVARVVTSASDNVLGFDVSEVHLYDEETGRLESATRTVKTDELLPETLSYEVGQGAIGGVFAAGASNRWDDITTIADDPGDSDIRSTICVPIGEYGTLAIGSTNVGEFTREDRQVTELLAANAVAAFRRAERQEELERYEEVLETVQEMVFVLDAAGEFELVTEPLAANVGYDRAELDGEHASLLLDDRTMAHGQQVVDDMLDSEADESATIRGSAITADNEEVPVEIELSLLDSGDEGSSIVGSVSDISELERTRERLHDERDRFSYLYNNLPDAVVETRLERGDTTVQSVNPAFADVFGYDPEAVREESLAEFVLPSDLDRTKLAAAEFDTQEVRRVTSEGLRHFLFRGIPFEQRSGPTHAFGIYTDITEQKRRQQYLQVVNRVVRHNLRNDLTVLLATIQQLDAGVSDAELDRHVEMLSDVTEGLVSLTEEAKQIEQAMNQRVETTPVDATATAASVVAEYRDSHPDADLTVETGDRDRLRVAADERLSVVVSHLVETTVAHGDDPRVTVEVAPSAGTASEWVEIRVRTDSHTIPGYERAILADDEQAVLADAERVTESKYGSGLGLWLAKWVVEAYGGRIHVPDDGGTGTEVVVKLERVTDSGN